MDTYNILLIEDNVSCNAESSYEKINEYFKYSGFLLGRSCYFFALTGLAVCSGYQTDTWTIGTEDLFKSLGINPDHVILHGDNVWYLSGNILDFDADYITLMMLVK